MKLIFSEAYMILSTLLRGAGIPTDGDCDGIDIKDIVTDSKRCTPGCMYICIRGNKYDGHDFLSEAMEKGAVCVLCLDGAEIPDIPEAVKVIRVKDTRRSMAHLYSSWYGSPQNCMKIIGVTGTNGKTTVSRMIYEILYSSGRKVGLIGTLGTVFCNSSIDIRSSDELSNLTTPDPEHLYKIFSVMRSEGAEYVVMEVSSHALALGKVSPITFEIGIFTNMTPEHLDFHGDMENYFEAKASMFSHCKKAIINCDNVYGRRLCKMYRSICLGCSCRGADVAVGAEQIQLSEYGVEYKLSHPKMRARIKCSIPGEFTVMNSLQATACACELGISSMDIKNALAYMSGVEGRLQRVKLPGTINFSVFIDYAHTPDALENLLRTARGFSKRKQRIILLFGCGGDRDRYKRSQMGRIASSMADFVIITSDNSRSEEPSDIIREILLGVDKESCFTVIESREAAIEYAIKNARGGDIILLAGKGHENYEIDKNGKRYFCESELVLKYVNKYHLSGDI